MVETGGLENRFGRKANGGSNPSPSAIESSLWLFFVETSRKYAKIRRISCWEGKAENDSVARSFPLRRLILQVS